MVISGATADLSGAAVSPAGSGFASQWDVTAVGNPLEWKEGTACNQGGWCDPQQ